MATFAQEGKGSKCVFEKARAAFNRNFHSDFSCLLSEFSHIQEKYHYPPMLLTPSIGLLVAFQQSVGTDPDPGHTQRRCPGTFGHPIHQSAGRSLHFGR